MNKEEIVIEIDQIISNLTKSEPTKIYYYSNSGKVFVNGYCLRLLDFKSSVKLFNLNKEYFTLENEYYIKMRQFEGNWYFIGDSIEKVNFSNDAEEFKDMLTTIRNGKVVKIKQLNGIGRNISSYQIPPSMVNRFFEVWRTVKLTSRERIFKSSNGNWHIFKEQYSTKPKVKKFYKLADEIFTTRISIIDRMRALAETNSSKFDEKDSLLIGELLKHHPFYLEKIGNGIDFHSSQLNEIGNGFEFIIHRIDGSRCNWSYYKAVDAFTRHWKPVETFSDAGR